MRRALINTIKNLVETCAMLAILYGAKAMSLSKNTFIKIEAFQTMIGNFILQLPGSTPRVSTWSEAELMPFKFNQWTRNACYYWETVEQETR